MVPVDACSLCNNAAVLRVITMGERYF